MLITNNLAQLLIISSSSLSFSLPFFPFLLQIAIIFFLFRFRMYVSSNLHYFDQTHYFPLLKLKERKEGKIKMLHKKYAFAGLNNSDKDPIKESRLQVQPIRTFRNHISDSQICLVRWVEPD